MACMAGRAGKSLSLFWGSVTMPAGLAQERNRILGGGLKKRKRQVCLASVQCLGSTISRCLPDFSSLTSVSRWKTKTQYVKGTHLFASRLNKPMTTRQEPSHVEPDLLAKSTLRGQSRLGESKGDFRKQMAWVSIPLSPSPGD